MASIISQPHFVLIPLMAQGHMIPMIDMARLFAERGVINLGSQSALFKSNSHAKKWDFLKGYENLDILPSPDLLRKFYKALSLLQKPLENYLEKQNPPPTCIISDKSLFWTSKTAQKFNIPRLVFHGMGCFSLLSSHNIKHYNAHQSVTSDSEPFVIPGLPQRIEITKAQLPGSFVTLPDLDDFRDKIQEAESTAYGVVVNSFDELEHECIEGYRKAINKKVWCVGPVSLCNKENLDKFERGNKAPIDFQQCLEWLNSMKPRSVIYACLGSLCRLLPSQLIELGLGLEASNQPFIWVIKTGEELENWFVKENFEERIKGRGLLIQGMGSTKILRIGVRVGVDIPVRWGEEERVGVLVKKYEVEKAIAMLMDEGEEGEKRRKKARELGEMARKAMEKGGSSELNMSFLIEDITKQSTMIV
uniref:Glycosyltransferase n=1 Tax=Fagus sylvatica TaxID=28930 RepID=A0A2N9HQM9_FAGSY